MAAMFGLDMAEGGTEAAATLKSRAVKPRRPQASKAKLARKPAKKNQTSESKLRAKSISKSRTSKTSAVRQSTTRKKSRAEQTA
jgi:hypothetical protein